MKQNAVQDCAGARFTGAAMLGPGRHWSKQRSSFINNLHRDRLWLLQDSRTLAGSLRTPPPHCSISLRGSGSCLKSPP